MSSLGDLITQLSTTTPLGATGATGTFTSLPFLTTEFNSYSLIMYSDIETQVVVEWSADSVHWDYTESFVMPANEATQQLLVVGNKWIRILINNLSGVAATVLRFSAYASPTNSSTDIIFPTNISVNANVRESFNYAENGNLMVSTFFPYQQYNFGYGTGSTAGDFQPTYPDLNVTTNKSGTTLYYFNTIQKGCLTIADVGVTGSITTIKSNDFLTWMPNIGLECTFSAAYSLNKTNGTGVLGTPYLMCGIASSVNNFGFLNEGILVGFNSSGAYNPYSPQNKIFGILYRSNTITPVTYFYSQENWNLDNCSGLFSMPNITDWSNFNNFKLSLLQNGNVLFSILNPKTGIWVPCHLINFTNAGQSAFQYPNFRFYAFQNNLKSTASYDNTGLSINNWSIGYQNNPVPNYISRFCPTNFEFYLRGIAQPSPNFLYGVSAVLQNPSTWNGQQNFITLYVDSISLGYVTPYPSFCLLAKNLVPTGGNTTIVDQYNTPASILSGIVSFTGTVSSLFSMPVPSSDNNGWANGVINPPIRVSPGENLFCLLYFVDEPTSFERVTTSLNYYQIH